MYVILAEFSGIHIISNFVHKVRLLIFFYIPLFQTDIIQIHIKCNHTVVPYVVINVAEEVPHKCWGHLTKLLSTITQKVRILIRPLFNDTVSTTDIITLNEIGMPSNIHGISLDRLTKTVKNSLSQGCQ
jgi:hypothetical protein